MQDCYERYRITDYEDPSDAILHSVISRINYKVVLHRHTYYEIFLIYSGRLLHEVNNKVIEIPSNTIIFIRPDDFHQYRQLGEENCGLVRLWVSTQIMEDLLRFLGNSSGVKRLLEDKLPPIASIQQTEMQSFVKRFEAVFSLHQEEESRRVATLKQLLIELVFHFIGIMNPVQGENLPPWLTELCRQISLKDNFVLGLERLFDLSPVSREHLSRSFKKYLGTTPTQYINRLRLNYAANQLANTNRKIVDICYDSGFGNLSYFYQSFKSAYGVTPKEYRFQKLTPVDLGHS
ncbi:MAG TPA: AraC family transcriptional regulator [Clostridiaceae bacterium]|nr:AraC family transcriptional regulator [Clostridiaceae bacterium]